MIKRRNTISDRQDSANLLGCNLVDNFVLHEHICRRGVTKADTNGDGEAENVTNKVYVGQKHAPTAVPALQQHGQERIKLKAKHSWAKEGVR